MSRAERRREAKGFGSCVACGKYRKLRDLGLCMACERIDMKLPNSTVGGLTF